MAKLTYVEQLRHPNWQRKRLECLKAAGWKCEACGANDQQLHVHHKIYIKGRMVWEYEYGAELEVLCDGCHAEKHAIETLLNRVLASAGDAKLTALGLVAGYLSAGYDLDPDLEKEVRATTDMVDIGIIAWIIAICDGYAVAEAIDKKLYPAEPDATRGPVVEDLLARWSRKP